MIAFCQLVLSWVAVAMLTFDTFAPLSVDRRLLVRAIAYSLLTVFFATAAMEGFALHEPRGYVGGTICAVMAGVAAWVAVRFWDDWRRRRRRRRKRSRGSVVIRLGRLVVVPR